MKQEFTDRKLGAIFGYTDHLQKDASSFSIQESVIQFLWNRNDEAVSLHLDDLQIQLQPGQLLTTTYFQHLGFPTTAPPLTALLFNREFYCIADHDEEVSCNGILFFGTQDLPIITIPEKQERKFELLLEVILEEFRTVDNIQGDMLQMLLKRLIIICTRLAKEQLIVQELNDGQIDTIRQFNVLVDMHFRTLRKVKDYADLLHKSPKTLSNLFSTYNQQSPQQIIQERVVLEAKRLILFTDKQTQEIAYDLGFDDPAYFSRFFKKQAGLTPSAFREQHVLGGGEE
ncbi:helix-turn-helix domain-containing protein [Lewinella cohaerens]|uniref:helix-turn-helix domain-containing protein n=1 Tax=Lewinella cohaerens TaxID=70995 RepID=UPI0003667CCC|nr:helix-turn-helix domain-containing protein [Lewinella cohaerens]